MQGLAALLVLALDAGSAPAPPSGMRQAAAEAVAGQPAPAVALLAPVRPDERVPPPCLGEVCQPQVAVPGYDPVFELRVRPQLVVEALDALHLEPLATAVWWLAATGVRLDLTPAALDEPVGGGAKVAHYQVQMRWEIDAFGGRIQPARRR